MMRRQQFMIGLMLVAMLIFAGTIAACRKPTANSSPPPVAASDDAQKNTRSDAGEDDERIIITNFNHALTELEAINSSCDEEDWEVADQHYKSFQQATRLRPQPKLAHPDISLALLDGFDLYNVQLEQAITSQDWVEATMATNQLANILNDLTAQLQSQGPETRRELRRLIFLNRELELWANRGNESMVRVRAARMRKAWTDLRPVVFDHHGSQAAEQFDAVAARLDKLESIEDYNNLSTDLTSAVTAVTAVFTEQR
jgi:hypothetical protein